MQQRTWDEQPVANTPPLGAAVVVYRRLDDRLEFLVLHRAHHGPEFAGDWAWGPPSGARLPDEEIDRCAQRELVEEMGVSLPVRRTAVGSERWCVYLADATGDCEITLSAEHDRYAWLPLDRAAELTTPGPVRAQLLAAARLIGEAALG